MTGQDKTRLPPRYSTGIFDPIESLVLSVLTKKYASTCNSRRLARNRSAGRPASSQRQRRLGKLGSSTVLTQVKSGHAIARHHTA